VKIFLCFMFLLTSNTVHSDGAVTFHEQYERRQGLGLGWTWGLGSPFGSYAVIGLIEFSLQPRQR
jgi:hypothetical protein